MLCSVAGCHAKATRYSNLCKWHRTVRRQRGHEQQASLYDTRLAPYLRLVRKHLKGQHGQRVLSLFREVWDEFVNAASQPLRDFATGKAVFRHDHEAALELQGLADTGDPETLLHALVALFLMREYEPGFFETDDSFAVTVQRYIRRKASGGYDLVWHSIRKRYTRKLRGIKQRAALSLGQMFVAVFAKNCGVLAHEIYVEEHRHLERARELNDALHDLKREWREDNARRSLDQQHQPNERDLPNETPETA